MSSFAGTDRRVGTARVGDEKSSASHALLGVQDLEITRVDSL